MEFDILDLTKPMLDEMNVVQMKMLRTAQQKKNELVHKAEKEMENFELTLAGNGTLNSSLIQQKKEDLDAELEYQCAIIVDQLLYNMSLNEPTNDEDMPPKEENPDTGYIVDYSLSYQERYTIVRDYYMSIEDKQERMAMFKADEVAKKYLDSYYSTLFDVLTVYSR